MKTYITKEQAISVLPDGDAVEGVKHITGEEYLSEAVRIAKMLDRGDIDTFEGSILLGKAVSRREAYLKKHPEPKTRPNPDAGKITITLPTTEWDVFNALSLKRLKKNAIHM